MVTDFIDALLANHIPLYCRISMEHVNRTGLIVVETKEAGATSRRCDVVVMVMVMVVVVMTRIGLG